MSRCAEFRFSISFVRLFSFAFVISSQFSTAFAPRFPRFQFLMSRCAFFPSFDYFVVRLFHVAFPAGSRFPNFVARFPRFQLSDVETCARRFFGFRLFDYSNFLGIFEPVGFNILLHESSRTLPPDFSTLFSSLPHLAAETYNLRLSFELPFRCPSSHDSVTIRQID